MRLLAPRTFGRRTEAAIPRVEGHTEPHVFGSYAWTHSSMQAPALRCMRLFAVARWIAFLEGRRPRSLLSRVPGKPVRALPVSHRDRA